MRSKEHKDEALITQNIFLVGMLIPEISEDSKDLFLLKYYLEEWWLIYILLWIVVSYLVVGIVISF